MTDNINIEEKYKKITQREHVLLRPDTYVGSMEKTKIDMWLVENINDFSNIKISKKETEYVPSFIKLYDEILTNASDHCIKTGKVKNIWINIDNNSISIKNDGPGIPIEKHKIENVWLPELIFGHLLTSSNYDDTEIRYVGGRNGLGAKLTAIFSKEFIIKTADGNKLYTQSLKENLNNIEEPIIEKSKDNWTEIKYYPDLERFKIDSIDDNYLNIFLKRAIDVAIYCKGLNIYFNSNKLPTFKKLEDYIRLYNIESNTLITEKINDLIEIGICQSDNDIFEQMSIVNGITTYQGGNHVKKVIDIIVNSIKEKLEKKYAKIKTNDIKDKLFLFLISSIPNPEFNTQTKEYLTSKIDNDMVNISDNFLQKIIKSDIMESIRNWLDAKELASIAKDVNKSSNRIKFQINKLEDANYAGTDKSKDCYLFLVEGDSAKAGVLSGISVLGRDYYGIFPLKGKVLNVRDLTLRNISENEELKNLFTILGLTPGQKQINKEDLRYGGIILMTDSDHDGCHIKGLLLNLFDCLFENLIQDNYIYELTLPLLVAKKSKEIKEFFNLPDYYKWSKEIDTSKWNIKYYKGLGSIDPKDEMNMCYYFQNIKKYLHIFNKDNKSNDLIDLSFNKKKSNDRKEWLSELTYEPNKF